MPEIYGTYIRIVVEAESPEAAVSLFDEINDGPATLVGDNGAGVPLAWLNVETLEPESFADATDGNDPPWSPDVRWVQAAAADNADSVKLAPAPFVAAPCIVVHGDPHAGFHYTGPFDGSPAAIDYGRAFFDSDETWWEAPLNRPDPMADPVPDFPATEER